MLLSLTLTNWRSHSSSSFTFSKGTNILVGKMGAGKSSVMDALCFALFGTFPKLARKETTLADTINFRNKSATCSVEITFKKNSDTYKISRSFSHLSSPSASISKNEKLFEKGPKAVTDAACKLLSIDFDSFVRAVYSEQNKIDSLLWLSPKERKAQIDELLGLDHFEAARSGAVFAANRFLDLYSQAEETLKTADLQALEKKCESLEKESGLIQAQLEGENSFLSTANSILEDNTKKLAGLSPLKEKYASLTLQKTRLGIICEHLEQEISSAEKYPTEQQVQEKISSSKQSIDSLLLSFAGLQKLCDSISQKVGTLSSQLKDAQVRSQKITSQQARLFQCIGDTPLASLQQQLSSMQESQRSLQAQRAALMATIAEVEKAVSALQIAGADCPVCGSPLGEEKSKHLHEEKNAQLQEGTQKLKDASANISSLDAQMRELEAKLKEAQTLSQSISALSENLPDASVISAELESANKELGSQIRERNATSASISLSQKEHEQLVQLLKQCRELASKKDELEKTRALLQSAQAELSSLNFKEEEFDFLRTLVESNKSKIEVSKAKLSSLQQQILSLSQMHSSCKKELALLLQLQQDATYYRKCEQEMLAYKNCMLQVQSQVRTLLIEEINAALSHIWPILYPYSDCTCVRLVADAKDYSIEMENNGWKSVYSLASGGERACLSLSLRVSFATVLTPHISWLILDEPTHNLDAQAVSMLASALSEKLPSIVEQIFVITHEQALVDSQQGTFYRLIRDNAKQEDTLVEKI
ncbi:DNA double-strand break repair Rad50 ATPase [Candidatus Anstonella stagnisolia]|nr:DNA double-strand break repair Rad50 ATPase [Candidatus Anstonella stagnisolia]